MLLVETILDQNAQLKARLSEKETQLLDRETRIAELEAQIAWLRRQMFAGGKSEKFDPAQLELLLKGLKERQTELTEQKEEISYERKKPSRRRSREECYENLPILEEKVIEPEEVLANPEAYERIGQEETFEVKVDPPRFYRCKTIRPRYRKINDKTLPPILAPAPVRIVEGLASPQLLAYIAISKYLDHLPLYRQCAIFKRHGFTVARSNLVRWVEKIAAWLKPIYNHMGKELLAGDYIQADETPIKYCDPDYGEKKTRQGYLCGYSRPGDNVYYRWSLSRSYDNVTAFLKPFKGILQSDAYKVYLQFEKSHEEVELAVCWAHARRKFSDALERHPRECGLVLKLIARLYKVEAEIREKELDPAATLAFRQKNATNSHARIKRVLMILRHRSLPKSELAKACNYSLNNWSYLTTYLNHGEISIDNNAMENAIRPTAIGRKNWLFIGHPKAGDRSAILYSILISCQRLEINPYDYLCDVLSKDTPNLSDKELAVLTPAKWKKAREAEG